MTDIQTFVDEALNISADLTTAMYKAEEIRRQYRESDAAVDAVKSNLAEFEAKFSMLHAEDVAVPDPRTKRTNKEYSDALMMEMLYQNNDWIDLSATYRAAQANHAILTTDLTNVVERVGVLKAQARLYSALLLAVSGES